MPTLLPRVQIYVFRALLTAVAFASAFTGGCDGQMAHHGTMQLGDGPLVASGGYAASSSEAVFEVPEANALTVAYGRENLPESYRLDDRMNIYTPTLNTATNQWPQSSQPDLAYVRYVYIPVNTSSSSQLIPVFRREGDRGYYYRRWY